MNKKWIDEKCEMLSIKLDNFKPNPKNFYFEPTRELYEKIESDKEEDIRNIAFEISKHIGLEYVPEIKYDWGIKMELEVAGQINMQKPLYDIQIPFFYVGKKYPLGGILAHEMTHAFLFSKNIYIDDVNENEMLTDLGAIFIGLGKLLLNGIYVPYGDNMQNGSFLGYLSPELIGYSYKKIALIWSINKKIMMENLQPNIKNFIEDIEMKI